MSRALYFERLVVRRLPGFPDGGPRLAELGPGVNLVLGPNESGKSTTARAIQGVLWPELLREHYADGPIEVEATLAWQGSSWTVRVEGGRARWQKDGVQHPTGPALPPPERAGRYLLSLQDLVAADDLPLANEIRRLSAGGIDFQAAFEELGLKAGGVPTRASAAWRTARRELQDAIRAARELREEERRLPGLESELDAAASDAAKLPVIQRLEELETARRRLEATDEVLASFPAGMAVLRAGDDENWRQLGKDLADEEARLSRALEEAAEASAARAETGLGDAPPGADVLSRLSDLDGRSRELQREVDAARGEVASAQAAEVAARGALGLGEGLDPAEALADDVIDRLDAVMEEGRRVREENARVEIRLDSLRGELEGGPDDPDDVEARIARASEVQELLRQWQGAGEIGPPAGPRPGTVRIAAGVVLLAGLALLVMGLVRGAEPDLLVTVAGGGVATIGCALFFLLWTPAVPDPREAVRERARSRGVEHADWSADGVRRRLEELARELTGLHQRRRTLDEVHRVETRELPAARSREAVWHESVVALTEEVGLARAGAGGPTLERVVHLLVAWDRTHRELAEARGALAGLEGSLEGVLTEAGKVGEPWFEAPPTPSALHGAVTDLSERVRRNREATKRLSDAGSDRDEAAARARELRRRRTEMLRRLDCDGADADRFLAERMRRLTDWQTAGEERRVAQAAVDRLDSDLRAEPETAAVRAAATDPETGRIDSRELARLQTGARQAEERARELQGKIGGIRRAVADGRRKHDVEEGMARRDEAVAELRAWRDSERDKAVARALLDRLRRDTEASYRPRVLNRARSLMSTITGGRYTLRLADASEGGFRAVFEESGQGRELDQLSSGTRVQLLLAVRLAFVEVQEGEGAALPLLLDEVLGTSDDDRARAIVQAATALARGGRQLIYFTAQADEVGKWRQAADADGGEGRLHTLVPGGGGTGQAEPALEWRTPETFLEPIPSPEAHDHHAYGAVLGVQALRLWAPRPVQALHPWHLTDDPSELHLLLNQGLRSWAQVETFVAHAGDAAADELRRIHEKMIPKAQLCHDFVELARLGRGRPVDRQALERTGAVSDVYIDRLSELCDDLGGDGQRLLEELDTKDDERAKGFRSDKADQLRDYLVAEGHLSLDEPLSERELLTRLMARAQRLDAPPSPAALERLIRRWSNGPSAG